MISPANNGLVAFQPLRFFLHSNPPKFADKIKSFHRWAFMVPRGGDFSTLQIGRFPPSKGATRAILAIAHSSCLQWVSARKRYVLMLPLVQLLDRSRELASMIFCPLDINRRASSVRAFISSLNHS
jgi:hypothetical protein